MQKKQKIKPENKKLKNYLELPLRAPSRSSFLHNSRTAVTLLFRCFLCFFFKGGRGVVKETFAIASTIRYLEDNLFFCLDAKETKDQA
jgi:hypothetical protein